MMTSRSLRTRHVLFNDLPAGVDFSDADNEDGLVWGVSHGDPNPLIPPKQLPVCMQDKRRLRDKCRWESSTDRAWDRWAQRQRRSWRRASEVVQLLASACSPWKKPLSEIEGRFGSGIHSFFTFLRFLVFLNLVALTLISACVLLPNFFFTQPSGAAGPREDATLAGWDPQCMNASAKDARSDTGVYSYFVHLFTGKGFLEASYLFYGHYQQREPAGSSFRFRLAYLLSILAYLLLCFSWITRQMVKEMIQKRMHSRNYRTRLSTKIFSGWDYCIRSTDAAAIKQQSIINDLKMDLGEEVRYLERQKMTALRKALLILTRVAVNLFILLLMAGAFYCIFQVTVYSNDHEQITSTYELWSWSVLTEYLPPFVISVANFVLPLAFAAMVRLEGYSPNAEINLTLMRSVLLKLASLGIFLFSLGQKVLCMGQREDPNCSTCGYNKNYQCWETTIGQEMYKMTVFNFLSTLLVTLLVRLPWRLIVDKTSWRLAQWYGKGEFDVSVNILDIVDEQTVVWIGLFYAPLLPLINSIFLFITFYIKKYMLFSLCKPSKTLFRASSSKFLFQFVLLLGLSLASVPLLLHIFNSPPSRACGLFSNYPTVWHVVPQAVATYLPPAAQRIIQYAGSKAFAFPLTIILSLVLTVYISQDRANRQTIRQLKTHLVLHAKDKMFLVMEISTAMKASSPAL
ncbi:transmembrane channel-like protein 8 isoform X1 [Lissotriton helveticus]